MAVAEFLSHELGRRVSAKHGGMSALRAIGWAYRFERGRVHWYPLADMEQPNAL